MVRNTLLALAAASMVATPTVASARDHGNHNYKSWKKAQKRAQKARYYGSTRYGSPVRTRYVSASPYYGSRYSGSRYGSRYSNYGSPYYGSSYYGSNYYGGSPYYGSYYGGSPYYGSYNNGYYGNRYNGGRYRCGGNQTAGALVGGALGAVVGSQVARADVIAMAIAVAATGRPVR